MKIIFNDSQKLNEIVFDKRNKNYGAYALRSAYNSTILKSLAIVSITVLLFALGVHILSKVVEEKNLIYTGPDQSIVTIFDGHVDAPKPKDPLKDPAGGSKTNAMATVIKDTASTNDDPNPDLFSNVNPNGNLLNTGTLTGVGNGTVVNTFTIAKTPELPTAFPAEGAEFEGGIKALYEFIANNTRYPDIAREMGKEGTVFVTFVIDEKGDIESCKILKGIGAGCDEEATRVINKIPRFKKPAKNTAGEPVKSIFNIPFKFKLQ